MMGKRAEMKRKYYIINNTFFFVDRNHWIAINYGFREQEKHIRNKLWWSTIAYRSDAIMGAML